MIRNVPYRLLYTLKKDCIISDKITKEKVEENYIVRLNDGTLG